MHVYACTSAIGGHGQEDVHKEATKGPRFPAKEI